MSIAHIAVSISNNEGTDVTTVALNYEGLGAIRASIANGTFNKVNLIKAVRDKYCFSLRDAKDMVEVWQNAIGFVPSSLMDADVLIRNCTYRSDIRVA